MKTAKEKKQKTILRTDGRSEEVRISAGTSLTYVFFTEHAPTGVRGNDADRGKAATNENTHAQNLMFILEGPNASVQVIGIDVATKGENTINLTIEHGHGDTRSHARVKSVLAGTARSETHGIIKVLPGADGSDAYFAHNTLLIPNQSGEQPHNRTVPALEIQANEVKAGHASTTGTFDALDMFYLMSRGLSHDNAKQLVLEGFAADALQQVVNAGARREALKVLHKKLEELVPRGEVFGDGPIEIWSETR